MPRRKSTPKPKPDPKKTPKKRFGRPRQLSERAKRFAREYVVDWNGRRAAIRVGYASNSADVTAARLLADARVKALVEEHRAEIDKKIDLTVEEIVHRLGLLSDANIADYVTWGPGGVTFLGSSKLTRDQAYCVQEVTQSTYRGETKTTFKLVDKVGPLRDLAKYKGLFVNKEIDPAAALRELAQMLGVEIDQLPEVES